MYSYMKSAAHIIVVITFGFRDRRRWARSKASPPACHFSNKTKITQVQVHSKSITTSTTSSFANRTHQLAVSISIPATRSSLLRERLSLTIPLYQVPLSSKMPEPSFREKSSRYITRFSLVCFVNTQEVEYCKHRDVSSSTWEDLSARRHSMQ